MLVTVSPKFQVVIPRVLRNDMGLLPGQKLQVVRLGNELIFVPVEKDIKKLRGFLGKMDLSDVRDNRERFG